MTQVVVHPDADEPGYAPEGCEDCGTGPGTFHYPGCPGAPRVCPGCFAFGEEPCASYCPDAAIEQARECAELDVEERLDLNDCDDWELEP